MKTSAQILVLTIAIVVAVFVLRLRVNKMVLEQTIARVEFVWLENIAFI